MKISELRSLIREEVRKVVKEATTTIPNVKFSISSAQGPKSTLKKFESFVTVKNAKTTSEVSMEGTLDLNVEALMSLLKSNKNYKVLEGFDKTEFSVAYKGADTMEMYNLPSSVKSQLLAVGEYELATKSQVAVTVGDFYSPNDLAIPAIAKQAVATPKFSSEKDVDQYLVKIGKALVNAGRKLVPGMKLGAMEDGIIYLELPSKPSPAIQSKLKALYRGAESVDI